MFFLPALLLAASAAVPPAPLTIDLDGDGRPETVRASASGSKIRLEIEDAAGKRVAKSAAASPGKASEIALSAGLLGDAGAILEVSAALGPRECRTFWRLRAGKLENVPLVGSKGRVADCASGGQWSDRWERPSGDAPADYVLEERRATPRGELHRTEIFRFAGFELRSDPKRSRAEIAGVPIPDIAPVLLYPKPLVEALLSCFNLSGFRSQPRLQIVTDSDEGIFEAVLEGGSAPQRIPVTAAKPGSAGGEFLWTAGSGADAAQLHVRLALDGRTPVEIATQGSAPAWNRLYNSVVRRSGGHLEVFGNAEDELATQALLGGWDSKSGKRIQVDLVTTSPAILDFDKKRVAVNLTDAPAGADVLLVPRNGSSPKVALRLRGPNAFTWLAVTCSGALATCRVGESGEEFRRLGTAMNVR